jgi:hypothetical protein
MFASPHLGEENRKQWPMAEQREMKIEFVTVE